MTVLSQGEDQKVKDNSRVSDLSNFVEVHASQEEGKTGGWSRIHVFIWGEK